MTAPQPLLIQTAVVQWHNRHPLAARIDASQVHSMGWVALPFMRPAQGIEPSLDAPRTPEVAAPPGSPGLQARLRQLWSGPKRAAGQPWPVFSQTFIDGIAPGRAAGFALAFGASAPAPADEATADWPQRRLEVDGALAERAAGAWPTELWVLSAAVEQGGRRVRVLVSPDGRAVIGPRLWHVRRLQALALVSLLALAGAGAWQLQRGPADAVPPPSTRASGVVIAPTGPASGGSAVQAASAPAAASAAAESASDAASSPLPSASGQAPADAASGPAQGLAPPLPSASAPLVDIRPRLGPNGTPRARPPSAQPAASAAPPLPGASASPKTSVDASPAPRTRPGKETSAAQAGRGAAAPESISPGQTASGPVVALVSPALLTKSDAEMMRERMLTHLGQTMGKTNGLQSEVIETAEGWRAAVYPFATREEAQILNATMVARGWRTRAVTF